MIFDGEDKAATNDVCFAMSSVIVKAGCTLYAFGDFNYTGDSVITYGPSVVPKFTIDNGNACGGCYSPA